MQEQFLKILKDARLNQKTEEMEINFEKIYELSSQHQVKPLVYTQIYHFSSIPNDFKNFWKRDTLINSSIQAIKTNCFLKLYQKFLENDLHILVVKGIICRELYPNPDLRTSNDEDLYVQKNEYEQACKIILENGFQEVEKSDDVTTFIHPTNGCSLELHTSLFNEDSKAYGQFQKKFNSSFEYTKIHTIQNIHIYSLNCDYHMLFLFFHFIKHFLHGGVGIRQILDIIQYAEKYSNEIHWKEIYETLENEHYLKLIENVYAIAINYLGFDVNKIEMPQGFDIKECDYELLLNDIIEAGIFGKSTEERLHSSTMTLNALEQGKTSILKSIFPTYKEMKMKFEYLNQYPILLPYAYLTRIISYLKHHDQKQSMKTIEIGNQRIELLKKYNVIK